MYQLIWLVPLLPLAGAAVNGLLGRKFRFSEKLVGGIAVGTVALAFLISVLAVWSYGFGSDARWPQPFVTTQFTYTWIPGGEVQITQGLEERATIETDLKAAEKARAEAAARGLKPGESVLVGVAREPARKVSAGPLNIEWSYQLDPLSAVFMLIVTGVGLCIFVFATGYMHGDTGFYRFFAYLGLFMFSMLVLVMGSNFLMMFVGWEGVGLCSYLLIGYYFDRKEAGDAARKAFITNRIGDFGFTLAIFGIIATFGTANYTEVFSRAGAYPLEAIGHWGLMSWLALGLFVGAIGKSAQIPLYVWLPDAMAGPTPVSALIHAATMVTAGLYMLTRTNVIFQHSQTMMLVVAIVGAVTALFAATIGITQNDIKKVLAYSTVSQLGFMFLACGVGAFVIGIFHVMTHAFFKALMFLGAGSVIHGMHHEQDMRRMGGLKKYMPITYMTFLAGWLAICGIIPFSGFWSKDEILWRTASTNFIPGGWILWLIATIAATCTAFYMTRLVAMTFWGKERFREKTAGGEADEAHAHAFDEGLKPHDAVMESAGDRPHHEPGEHVGAAHEEDARRDIVGHEDSPMRGSQAPGGILGHEDMPIRASQVPDPREHEAAHTDEHGHHHGSHVPHESPRSMWIPLVALAVLATIGGFLGISPAFTGGSHVGGKLNIVNWLEPVIWTPQEAVGRRQAAGGGEHAASGEATAPGGAHSEKAGDEEPALYGDTGFNLAHSIEGSLGKGATEWLFIIISLVVAGVGIGLGWLFYVKKPSLPDVWAARLRPLYRASYNKYWVDELYAKLFTRRTMDAARGVYAVDSKVIDGAVNGSAWLTRLSSRITGGFDKYVVDGLVNGVANFIGRLMSRLIRAAQTGLTANYALVMVLGLVLAVALFFGKDLLAAVGLWKQ